MSSAVDLTNARVPEYSAILREIQATGHCPFCPEHFFWHPRPIIFSEDGWRLTENAHPYQNAERHFLIIPDEHKEQMWDLSPADLAIARNFVLKARNRFRFDGGALVVRFGDTKLSGATVRHLHFHLIVPKVDIATGRALPVYFPIG